MIITISDALKVVGKFELVERTNKERFYKLVYDGVTILTTSIPKGRGPLHVTNQFRKQLYLEKEQLAGAINCPFKKTHWYASLKDLGVLPEEEDQEP